MAQRNQQCAMMPVGKAEHALGQRLIPASRLAASDPEPGGGQHHLHGSLTEIGAVEQEGLARLFRHD